MPWPAATLFFLPENRVLLSRSSRSLGLFHVFLRILPLQWLFRDLTCVNVAAGKRRGEGGRGAATGPESVPGHFP